MSMTPSPHAESSFRRGPAAELELWEWFLTKNGVAWPVSCLRRWLLEVGINHYLVLVVLVERWLVCKSFF